MGERAGRGVFQLQNLGIPPMVAESFAALLDDDSFERIPGVSPGQPGGDGLMVPCIRWVIRNDDLDLIDCTWKVAVVVLGVNVFAPSAGELSTVLGSIAALYKVWRQLNRKGTTLDPLQYKVLSTLKLSGRCDIERLADLLNKQLIDGEPHWTIVSLREYLEQLGKVGLNDGTMATFAAEDGEGRWGVVGL